MARNYLRRWFILDLLGNFPCGLFKVLPHTPSSNDLHNLLVFNFAYIPRIYVVWLVLKLIRIRKAKPVLIKILKRLGFGIDLTNLITTFWLLILIDHILACMWGTSGTFNTSSSANWIVAIGI